MYLCSRARCDKSKSRRLEAGRQLVQTPQMQEMGDAVQEVAGDVRVDGVEELRAAERAERASEG
jgi:hypothetical protein